MAACPACGAAATAAASFCVSCGTRLPPAGLPEAAEPSSEGVPREPRRRRPLGIGILAGLVVTASIVAYPYLAARMEAERHLKTIVALGKEPLRTGVVPMLDWQRRLNAILEKVEANDRVRRRFEELLSGAGATAARASISPLRLIAASSSAQTTTLFEQLRAELKRTAEFGIWDRMKRAAAEAKERAADLLPAAAREAVHGEYVRDPQAFDAGVTPARAAYERGEYRAAYAVSNPASARDCPAGYVYGDGSCAVDLAGTWRGRYRWRASKVVEGRSFACNMSGPVTLQIRQRGATISGTLYLGGSFINYETCTALRDEQYPFGELLIRGVSVDSATLRMFRRSQHWLIGTLLGENGDVAFDAARAVN